MITYKVKITAFAGRVATRFSPEVRKAAKAALKELANNPFIGKELQAELSGFRSYRFLRYCLVFTIDAREKCIIIWAIGHRRDIYEVFGRHLLHGGGE